MEVRGDGIGNKALLYRGNGVAEPETARAMPHVKDDSALPRLGQDRIELAVREQDGKLLREHVRVNIPRPHLLQDQVGVGPLRAGPEIHHDRDTG